VLRKLLVVLLVGAGLAFFWVKLFELLDNFDASVAARAAQ
jgi:hypothetical protein